jgi:hypothetical protein
VNGNGIWRRLRLAALGLAARALYGFLKLTVRPVTFADAEEIFRTMARNERIIVAFWHGQLAMVQIPYRGPGVCIQVSRHDDGEIISRAVRPYGIRTARGSATRGGVASLREMLRAFGEGYDLAVACDGPRGPLHQAKIGAVQLAQATGVRLFPIACAPRRGWVSHRSWDRFTIPRPFTRVYYAVGEPMLIRRDRIEGTTEEARRRLESELNRLTEEAERRARG